MTDRDLGKTEIPAAEDDREFIASDSLAIEMIDYVNTQWADRYKLNELIATEQLAWKVVLGVIPEIKPPPKLAIDKETRERLENFGFKLIYLPRLDLGTLNELKTKKVPGYLQNLQERYPGWRQYEKINKAEKSDFRVSRNLSREFWDLVRKGQVGFPELKGEWIAVEERFRLSFADNFSQQESDISSRFGLSYQDAITATQAVRMMKGELFGLTNPTKTNSVRIPTALEYNLIANREGWGSSDSWEWTRTEVVDPQARTTRICIGHFRHGGAAVVALAQPHTGYRNVGFRLIISLSN